MRQSLLEFYDPFLMAGWTKIAALAGECKQVLVSAIFAFYAGEAIVQISVIEIAVNNLLDIRKHPYCRSNCSS